MEELKKKLEQDINDNEKKYTIGDLMIAYNCGYGQGTDFYPLDIKRMNALSIEIPYSNFIGFYKDITEGDSLNDIKRSDEDYGYPYGKPDED